MRGVTQPECRYGARMGSRPGSAKSGHAHVHVRLLRLVFPIGGAVQVPGAPEVSQMATRLAAQAAG
eukprot:6275323-Prymnesium_polylepis.2